MPKPKVYGITPKSPRNKPGGITQGIQKSTKKPSAKPDKSSAARGTGLEQQAAQRAQKRMEQLQQRTGKPMTPAETKKVFKRVLAEEKGRLKAEQSAKKKKR